MELNGKGLAGRENVHALFSENNQCSWHRLMNHKTDKPSSMLQNSIVLDLFKLNWKLSYQNWSADSDKAIGILYVNKIFFLVFSLFNMQTTWYLDDIVNLEHLTNNLIHSKTDLVHCFHHKMFFKNFSIALKKNDNRHLQAGLPVLRDQPLYAIRGLRATHGWKMVKTKPAHGKTWKREK